MRTPAHKNDSPKQPMLRQTGLFHCAMQWPLGIYTVATRGKVHTNHSLAEFLFLKRFACMRYV